jgi:hypothetical protein
MTQRTLALLFSVTLWGCGQESPRGQQQFDLTSKADRVHFRGEGLAYQGVVGPYAVFRVTGVRPRLVGPRVGTPDAAALLAAKSYFTTASGAPTAQLVMRRNHVRLLAAPLSVAHEGDCVEGETPESEVPGVGTGLSTTTGGGGGTTSSGGDGPCDMGSDGDVVTVDVEGAPEGAVVLIGRIALTRPRSWDPTHLQPVCCEGEECVVGTDPSDPPYGTEQGGPVK